MYYNQIVFYTEISPT